MLLGLATVATAWGAYQASVWGGRQDTALTSSTLLSGEAADWNQFADSTRSFDQSLFIEIIAIIAEGGQPDDPRVLVFSESFSEPGQAAFQEWLDRDDLDDPFESETYDEAVYGLGRQKYAESDAAFQAAQTANNNSDDYVLASAFFASVLFLAGVSSALDGARIRETVLGGAGLTLLGALIFLLTLPVA